MKRALFIKREELPQVIRSSVESTDIEYDENINYEEFVSYYESLACMIDEHFKSEKRHRRTL
jgi:hypothetical protein